MPVNSISHIVCKSQKVWMKMNAQFPTAPLTTIGLSAAVQTCLQPVGIPRRKFCKSSEVKNLDTL